MMTEEITPWLAKLSAGDPRAAQVIWDRYFERLVRYARRKLDGLPRRVQDEEDVALSAMHSFCRGMRAGRFERVEHGDDLWKLRVTIAARKAFAQRRRGFAEKRGAGRRRQPS